MRSQLHPTLKSGLLALPAIALALAAGSMSASITPASAQLAPPTCPSVGVALRNYKPKRPGRKATSPAPGVRARIFVSEPSQLVIRASLRWFEGSQRQSVPLLTRTLGAPRFRNLRFPQPGATGGLQVRDGVTLVLVLTAAPDSSPGCVPAARRIALRTRVVVVQDDR